jgi:hypothetical protein
VAKVMPKLQVGLSLISNLGNQLHKACPNYMIEICRKYDRLSSKFSLRQTDPVTSVAHYTGKSSELDHETS